MSFEAQVPVCCKHECTAFQNPALCCKTLMSKCPRLQSTALHSHISANANNAWAHIARTHKGNGRLPTHRQKHIPCPCVLDVVCRYTHNTQRNHSTRQAQIQQACKPTCKFTVVIRSLRAANEHQGLTCVATHDCTIHYMRRVTRPTTHEHICNNEDFSAHAYFHRHHCKLVIKASLAISQCSTNLLLHQLIAQMAQHVPRHNQASIASLMQS